MLCHEEIHYGTICSSALASRNKVGAHGPCSIGVPFFFPSSDESEKYSVSPLLLYFDLLRSRYSVSICVM